MQNVTAKCKEWQVRYERSLQHSEKVIEKRNKLKALHKLIGSTTNNDLRLRYYQNKQ